MENVITPIVKIAPYSQENPVPYVESFNKMPNGEKKPVMVVRLVTKTPVTRNSNVSFEKRYAFVRLEEEIFEYYNDMFGFEIDSEYPVSKGKLVHQETTTPYVNSKNQKSKPKTRGKGGAVITHNGMPVYRNTIFTTDLSEQDVLLKSDAIASTSSESSDEAFTADE